MKSGLNLQFEGKKSLILRKSGKVRNDVQVAEYDALRSNQGEKVKMWAIFWSHVKGEKKLMQKKLKSNEKIMLKSPCVCYLVQASRKGRKIKEGLYSQTAGTKIWC